MVEDRTDRWWSRNRPFVGPSRAKKMLNTTSWYIFHAMLLLLKTFYNHSIDQWPTFIFKKVTHDGICTLAGDMHTRNVVTM